MLSCLTCRNNQQQECNPKPPGSASSANVAAICASGVTQTEVSSGSIVMQPSAEAGSQTKRAAAKQQTDLCPEDKAKRVIAKSGDLMKAAAVQQQTKLSSQGNVMKFGAKAGSQVTTSAAQT